MMQAQPTQTTLVKTEAQAEHCMVATKDRHATQAGLDMLKAGGNAIDAAVAACFAIAVVEPASSGIGGGGYLVYQVGDQGGAVGFPMRAPLEAGPDMYQLTGEPGEGNFGWPGVVNNDNFEGYRSIAVPGAVAGLCEAHRLYGRLPLKDVIAPAVALARDGFLPGWHSIYSLGTQAGKLFKYGELGNIFMPGGQMPTGDMMSPPVLRQPDLSQVLDAIGREGPDAYYRGDVGKAIVSDIRQNGGVLSEEDMAQYRPILWDKGLEFPYRGHTVRVPPFACAGTTSAMTLKLLDGFRVSEMGHNSVEMLHAYISCARLAYADRFAYLGDPEFADVPWKGLLSDNYTQLRRWSIGDRAPEEFLPGDPWLEEGRRPDPDKVLAPSLPAWDSGTTHLCVVDGEGNAVSLTNTIMSGFGSGVVPKGTGIVMNNGMWWFDPVPGRVNSVMPGKLPLNNMTPALVLEGAGASRRVRLAVGASGGRRITNCVTQIIVKALDFGMSPQAAIDSPRVDCSMPFTSLDPRIDQGVRAGLESRGHRIKVIAESGLQAGFGSFASPVAILAHDHQGLTAGVDTFHSAYAQGI